MGDPACFLSTTCLACGRVLEGDQQEARICIHCGAPIDGSSTQENEKVDD